MAAAPVFVPVEEYLQSSYSPDAEYIDGQIVERESTMGENEHSAWQEAICAWFRAQAVSAGIRVRPELRVQVDAYGFLIPDVTLLDRNLPAEPIATHPPVAVIDVLSPAEGRTLREDGDSHDSNRRSRRTGIPVSRCQARTSGRKGVYTRRQLGALRSGRDRQAGGLSLDTPAPIARGRGHTPHGFGWNSPYIHQSEWERFTS
jgi:hypothetical protein